MKENKISNIKIEVPVGIEMNDKDYLTSILELEKNMSNNYSIALNEASNDELYEDFFSIFEDTKDISRDIYNLMFKNGWYTLEKAEENKIQEKLSCFQSELNDLENME